MKNDFNKSLELLENVADDLSHRLDELSSQIRTVEQKLSNLNANFPFQHPIVQEESLIIPVNEQHLSYPGIIMGSYTQVCWFLAWVEDEVSNKFRLFLISENRVSVNSDVDGNCTYRDFLVSTETTYKKPLIEAKLALRARFGNFLQDFIEVFSDHLIKQDLGF